MEQLENQAEEVTKEISQMQEIVKEIQNKVGPVAEPTPES